MKFLIGIWLPLNSPFYKKILSSNQNREGIQKKFDIDQSENSIQAFAWHYPLTIEKYKYKFFARRWLGMDGGRNKKSNIKLVIKLIIQVKRGSGFEIIGKIGVNERS